MIPFHFIRARKGRLLIATSPDQRHLETFKENPGTNFDMPTWNWEDLYCLMYASSSQSLLKFRVAS